MTLDGGGYSRAKPGLARGVPEDVSVPVAWLAGSRPPFR
jgi:hypothetical protein